MFLKLSYSVFANISGDISDLLNLGLYNPKEMNVYSTLNTVKYSFNCSYIKIVSLQFVFLSVNVMFSVIGILREGLC